MKILMFGWEFPPFNSGGLGVACFGLTKALSLENVKVFFVLPKKLDLKIDFATLLFADNNPSTYPIDPLFNGYITSDEYQKTAALYPRYENSLLDEVVRYAYLSRDLIKNLDFDIIHAHDWLSFLAGIEAKKISGKPLIVHVHATEYDRSGGQNINSVVYSIEKLGMEKADQIIAVSNFTKNILISKYGINPEKIMVVHNGIDASFKDSTKSQSDLLDGYKKRGFKIVLFVGRFTLQKGPDYFVKTAKKVLEYNPKVLFVMAGSGDMEKQIIGEAINLGISDNIIFTGFLRGEELDRLYRGADLFVFPSVSEPFGLAPLESVARGTPVLISRQAGVGEVLNNALKADFWDIEDMTDKILSAIEHPSLLNTLSQNSFSELQNKTWKSAAQKMVCIYRNILSKFYRP